MAKKNRKDRNLIEDQDLNLPKEIKAERKGDSKLQELTVKEEKNTQDLEIKVKKAGIAAVAASAAERLKENLEAQASRAQSETAERAAKLAADSSLLGKATADASTAKEGNERAEKTVEQQRKQFEQKQELQREAEAAAQAKKRKQLQKGLIKKSAEQAKDSVVKSGFKTVADWQTLGAYTVYDMSKGLIKRILFGKQNKKNSFT